MFPRGDQHRKLDRARVRVRVVRACSPRRTQRAPARSAAPRAPRRTRPKRRASAQQSASRRRTPLRAPAAKVVRRDIKRGTGEFAWRGARQRERHAQPTAARSDVNYRAWHRLPSARPQRSFIKLTQASTAVQAVCQLAQPWKILEFMAHLGSRHSCRRLDL
eukprot:781503-Pleurochrysis_carterae.AAC.1